MERPDGLIINAGGEAFVYNPSTNSYDPRPEFNNVVSSPSGENFGASPKFVDFSGLPTPYVNFLESLGLAQEVGAQNRQTYFDNINRSRDIALGLVDTDVEGITRALNVLGPRYRQEGDIDTQTNISRAGVIDAFNIGRIPSINQANRRETQAANRFNSQQFQESIETSGINYRERIQGVIGRLEDRAEGRLPGALNEQLTRDLANTGSDLAAASGIGATSGAGIRVGDRLTVQEKINLAVNADAQLPGVLSSAQGILQSPYERAPTAYTAPTQVPLNPSDLASRIPVTSNVSAGAAQQAIGQQATSLEVIPATQVLNSSLATEQFNAQSAFNAELIKGEKLQQQFDTQTGFIQSLLNADKGDQIRQESFDAYLEGLEIRADQQGVQAAGSVGGFLQNLGSVFAGGAQLINAASGGQTGGQQPQQSGGSQGTTSSQQGIVLQGTTSNIPVSVPSGGGGTGTPGGASGGSYGGGSTYFKTSGGTVPSTNTSYPGGGPVLNGPTSTRYSGGIASPTSNPAAPDTINAINSGAPSVNTLARTVPRSLTDASAYFRQSSPAGASADSQRPAAVRIGNAEVTEQDYNNLRQSADSLYKTGQLPERVRREGTRTGDYTSPNTTTAQAVGEGIQQAQQDIAESIAPLTGVYNQVTQPFSDVGIDSQTLLQTAGTFSNWQNATPQDKFNTAGQLGVAVIQNQGLVDPNQAETIKDVTGTFGVLVDPNAKAEDKAIALAQLGTSVYTPNFTGNINSPETINGQTVTGSTVAEDGSRSFMLANGETFQQSTLVNGTNTMAAVNAFSVLVSDADDDKKLASLTAIGIRPAEAQGLIGQVSAGNLTAGLSLFNTTTAWDQMNPIQQAAATIQTSSVVTTAIADTLISQGTTNAATSFFTSGTASATSTAGASGASAGTSLAATEGSAISSSGSSAAGAGAGLGAQVLQGAAGGAALGLGIYQAADVISAINDMPQSQAEGQGALGGAAAGASIGAGAAVTGALVSGGATAGAWAGPIGMAVGAVIGAAVGVAIANTGSGKNTGQSMRDGWRGGLEEAGIASKNPETGSHEVTLADGTKYDIGRDGNAKLTNADGTERHTFDVDWSDPKAAETVPDAHIFAIATGLDPTDSASHGLFNRAVAQGLNAASSNAQDVQGVRDNFKAMMKDIDPRQVGMRVEILRQTNKITEEEYNTYLNSINRTFGTQLTATEKDKGRDYILGLLNQNPEPSKYERNLLKELTDPREIEKVISQRDARMRKDKRNRGE